VVGLGNPGREYEATRHNAGFWFVDKLALALHASLRTESRFHGQVARVSTADDECWLLKPTTFMNASGRAVQALTQFYKIEVAQILVVHDELDLPPGDVRLKKGGGVAGHNGLKDISARLGADFWRLRIGIGHPGERERVIGYVLERARREEGDLIEAAIERGLEVWPQVAAGEMERAMHALHTRKN
jgi:PTH1 family peptidyl-tRNA hydrolase